MAKDPKYNLDETGSPWGAGDMAPILTTPRNKKPEELTEEEYIERYGPPYGPCGIPCECADCTMYRRKLRESGPAGPPRALPSRDKFSEAVEKVISSEHRVEWREAIRESHCFAKLWYSEEDRSYCSEMDCPLRNLCQYTWESVCGGMLENRLEDHITTPPKTRRIGRKLVYKDGNKIKTRIRHKWKGTGRYDRVPYVSQGRPIDSVASVLWEMLGSPPSLPETWSFSVSKTKDQLAKAKAEFLDRFGSGLYVIRRASYHQYMLDGEHLMRIWVNAAGGGWVDCNKKLSGLLLMDDKNLIAATPSSGKDTKYRWYPYRIFLSKDSSLERLKIALTKYTELAYLYNKDQSVS